MCSSSSFVHSPKQKPASQPARRGSGSPAGRPGPPGRRLTSCCSPSPRLKTWLASSEFRPAFREVVAVIGARRNVEAFITYSWAHDHHPSFHPHQYVGMHGHKPQVASPRPPAQLQGGRNGAHMRRDASVGSRAAHCSAPRARGPWPAAAAGGSAD